MIFKAYLGRYQFFPIINIADEQNHQFYESELINQQAKIYFFVKSKNYFSDVKSDFGLANVTGFVNNPHGSRESFDFAKYLPFIGAFNINQIPQIEKEIKENGVYKLAKSPSNVIDIYKRGEIMYTMHLYQLINGRIITVPKDFLESNILYIGKSDTAKGILKGRIYKHEKTLPILGEHGTSNDEILVFIFEIRCENDNIQRELYIPVVEEILIRYFQPNKNKEYISEKNGQTKHVKELMDLGFTDYYMELNFDDDVCRFGSETIIYSKKHIIKGELSKIHQ